MREDNFSLHQPLRSSRAKSQSAQPLFLSSDSPWQTLQNMGWLRLRSAIDLTEKHRLCLSLCLWSRLTLLRSDSVACVMSGSKGPTMYRIRGKVAHMHGVWCRKWATLLWYYEKEQEKKRVKTKIGKVKDCRTRLIVRRIYQGFLFAAPGSMNVPLTAIHVLPLT